MSASETQRYIVQCASLFTRGLVVDFRKLTITGVLLVFTMTFMVELNVRPYRLVNNQSNL